MAGHYGVQRTTTQNIEIVRVDAERGLLLVKGNVPGPENGWVEVRDAVKKVRPEGVTLPGVVKAKEADAAPEAESEGADA